jgi:hypothetical protein
MLAMSDFMPYAYIFFLYNRYLENILLHVWIATIGRLARLVTRLTLLHVAVVFLVNEI